MLFIAVLILTPFLVLTYRVKNRLAFWLLIVVPPFLLTPLIVLPVRGPQTLGALFPLLVFFPISLIILLVRIVQLIRKKPDNLLKVKFIRPALVIVIFLVAHYYQKASLNSADAYAIDLADQLQQQCESNGYCLASIDGWQTNTYWLSHEPYCESSVKKLGINYPVHYSASADGKSFMVTLVHGFNMALNIKGGVGKGLKAVYSGEETTREIPITTKSAQPVTNVLSILPTSWK